MECIIILNGDKPEKLGMDFFKGKYIICADGAYSYALSMGIKTDLLIGDMDSIAEIPQGVKILKFSSDKDSTDGQLALDEAVKSGFADITFIGGSGGREDHFFANICLLSRALQKGVRARMVSDYSETVMFNKDLSVKTDKGIYFSIVPFGGVLHIMNTEGLKYAICDRKLYPYDTLGISNETTAEIVNIKVKSGCGLAFIIHEKIKVTV